MQSAEICPSTVTTVRASSSSFANPNHGGLFLADTLSARTRPINTNSSRAPLLTDPRLPPFSARCRFSSVASAPALINRLEPGPAGYSDRLNKQFLGLSAAFQNGICVTTTLSVGSGDFMSLPRKRAITTVLMRTIPKFRPDTLRSNAAADSVCALINAVATGPRIPTPSAWIRTL